MLMRRAGESNDVNKNRRPCITFDCASSASELKARNNKLFKKVKTGLKPRLTVKFRWSEINRWRGDTFICHTRRNCHFWQMFDEIFWTVCVYVRKPTKCRDEYARKFQPIRDLFLRRHYDFFDVSTPGKLKRAENRDALNTLIRLKLLFTVLIYL